MHLVHSFDMNAVDGDARGVLSLCQGFAVWAMVRLNGKGGIKTLRSSYPREVAKQTQGYMQISEYK